MTFICMELDMGEPYGSMESVQLCVALCTAAFLLLTKIQNEKLFVKEVVLGVFNHQKSKKYRKIYQIAILDSSKYP